ncbi:MAG: hypothetical protein ACKVOL_14370 [Novosphingobium sp.]
MNPLIKRDPQIWREHRVVVLAGMYDYHATTGECYETRTLADMFDLNPTCKPKQHGPAFIPSSYAKYDARSHAVQQAHGSFVALTAEVDDGDHALAAVAGAIASCAGSAAHLIYSSPHARPGDRRWRAILPLAGPVPHAEWHDGQTALCDHLELVGIRPDRALCRAAQPVFLPNVPRIQTKTCKPLRGHNGEPIFSCGVRPGSMRLAYCLIEALSRLELPA